MMPIENLEYVWMTSYCVNLHSNFSSHSHWECCLIPSTALLFVMKTTVSVVSYDSAPMAWLFANVLVLTENSLHDRCSPKSFSIFLCVDWYPWVFFLSFDSAPCCLCPVDSTKDKAQNSLIPFQRSFLFSFVWIFFSCVLCVEMW